MNGKVFEICEPLSVMESIDTESIDLVYVDMPLCSGTTFLSDGEKVVSEYREYVAKIVENTWRTVKTDGTAVFLVPSKEFVDIEYRLIFKQFFRSYNVITIDQKKTFASDNLNTNQTLYFFSKLKNKKFPALYELAPEKNFPQKDEIGIYKQVSLTTPGGSCRFEWHGIIPPQGQQWKYSKNRLDDLLSEGRILLRSGKAMMKWYRHEHPIRTSPVWNAEDKFRTCTFSIDSQSLERIFDYCCKPRHSVFCPFDRDGKFSLLANRHGLSWIAVKCSFTRHRPQDNLWESIPSADYETVSKIKATIRQYVNNIVTSISDIKALQRDIADIKRFSNTSDEASITDVIQRIHVLIEQCLTIKNLKDSLPEARDWIAPYWDKLEPESQYFLPTGVFLYNQYRNEDGIDMAPIMLEYCRVLENELLKKMFFPYIKKLINRKTVVSTEFSESFTRTQTKEFARFLEVCTTKYADKPKSWKLEMGKMAVILQAALAKHPQDQLTADFKKHLEHTFGQTIIKTKTRFAEQLATIKEMRNSCAHPSSVPQEKIDECKELIKKKLMLILENYIHNQESPTVNE